MAVTALDATTALVVIDLQKGIVALPAVGDVNAVIARAAELARAFRARRLPVVLVHVEPASPGRTERNFGAHALPPDWSELVPELGASEDDIRVTKHSWGAFTGTNLDASLRARGVTQIVICGVATSIGVESTAREAYALGYNVTLASDAMTDLNAEAQENSLARIFPRLGETGTATEILTKLGS